MSERQDPRANQKARTRAALVEAAQERRAQTGELPTISEAAARAGISRATAYRYFPTQQALELEIAELTPAVVTTEDALARLATDNVEERLAVLLDAFNPIAFANEEHFRRSVWVYQDTWLRNHRGAGDEPAVREGRRMRWLERVLEPLARMPDERRRRLAAAIALTLGADALVVMKDVCRLDDDEEALAVLRWAAIALLRAGLAEEASGGSDREHPAGRRRDGDRPPPS